MSDRDLNHLYPDFRLKVIAIRDELTRWCNVHKPGYFAILVEGFRTTKDQQAIFAKNTPTEIYTYKDGVKNKSNHQSGLAADIAPSNGRQADFDDKVFFAYLQHLAHVNGLTSGADWKTFKDLDHIEHPTSDQKTYAAARKWLKDQRLV